MKRFLSELANFAGVQQKPHALYDKTIIVMRPETLLDLQRIESNIVRIYGADESQVVRYSARPVDPMLMLNHKSAAILDPKSKHFIQLKERKRRKHQDMTPLGVRHRKLRQAVCLAMGEAVGVSCRR